MRQTVISIIATILFLVTIYSVSAEPTTQWWMRPADVPCVLQNYTYQTSYGNYTHVVYGIQWVRPYDNKTICYVPRLPRRSATKNITSESALIPITPNTTTSINVTNTTINTTNTTVLPTNITTNQTNTTSPPNTSSWTCADNATKSPAKIDSCGMQKLHGGQLYIKHPYPKINGTFVDFVFVCNMPTMAGTTKYSWFYDDGHKLIDITNRDTYHRFPKKSGPYQVVCVARNGTHYATDMVLANTNPHR